MLIGFKFIRTIPRYPCGAVRSRQPLTASFFRTFLVAIWDFFRQVWYSIVNLILRLELPLDFPLQGWKGYTRRSTLFGDGLLARR